MISCSSSVPAFIFAIHVIHHYCNFSCYFAKFDFKHFHQHPHLILLATFSPLLMILAIICLNFDIKTLSCAEMCIMGNSNDPLAHIPSWRFPDENLNSTSSGLMYNCKAVLL